MAKAAHDVFSIEFTEVGGIDGAPFGVYQVVGGTRSVHRLVFGRRREHVDSGSWGCWPRKRGVQLSLYFCMSEGRWHVGSPADLRARRPAKLLRSPVCDQGRLPTNGWQHCSGREWASDRTPCSTVRVTYLLRDDVALSWNTVEVPREYEVAVAPVTEKQRGSVDLDGRYILSDTDVCETRAFRRGGNGLVGSDRWLYYAWDGCWYVGTHSDKKERRPGRWLRTQLCGPNVLPGAASSWERGTRCGWVPVFVDMTERSEDWVANRWDQVHEDSAVTLRISGTHNAKFDGVFEIAEDVDREAPVWKSRPNRRSWCCWPEYMEQWLYLGLDHRWHVGSKAEMMERRPGGLFRSALVEPGQGPTDVVDWEQMARTGKLLHCLASLTCNSSDGPPSCLTGYTTDCCGRAQYTIRCPKSLGWFPSMPKIELIPENAVMEEWRKALAVRPACKEVWLATSQSFRRRPILSCWSWRAKLEGRYQLDKIDPVLGNPVYKQRRFPGKNKWLFYSSEGRWTVGHQSDMLARRATKMLRADVCEPGTSCMDVSKWHRYSWGSWKEVCFAISTSNPQQASAEPSVEAAVEAVGEGFDVEEQQSETASLAEAAAEALDDLDGEDAETENANARDSGTRVRDLKAEAVVLQREHGVGFCDARLKSLEAVVLQREQDLLAGDERAKEREAKLVEQCREAYVQTEAFTFAHERIQELEAKLVEQCREAYVQTEAFTFARERIQELEAEQVEQVGKAYIQTEAFNFAHERIHELEVQLSEPHRQNDVTAEAFASAQARVSDLQVRLEEQERHARAAGESSAFAQSRIRELEAKLEKLELQAQLDVNASALADVRTKELEAELEQQKRQATKQSESSALAKARIQELEAELEQQKRQATKQSESSALAKARIQELEDKLEEQEQRAIKQAECAAHVQDRLRQLEAKLEEKEQQATKQALNSALVKARMEELEAKLEEKEQQATKQALNSALVKARMEELEAKLEEQELRATKQAECSALAKVRVQNSEAMPQAHRVDATAELDRLLPAVLTKEPEAQANTSVNGGVRQFTDRKEPRRSMECVESPWTRARSEPVDSNTDSFSSVDSESPRSFKATGCIHEKQTKLAHVFPQTTCVSSQTGSTVANANQDSFSSVDSGSPRSFKGKSDMQEKQTKLAHVFPQITSVSSQIAWRSFGLYGVLSATEKYVGPMVKNIYSSPPSDESEPASEGSASSKSTTFRTDKALVHDTTLHDSPYKE
eukprot:TRINITY_DN8840_c0_g1_i2.p1 TRINITY_DN8840_c0_g1~~TRINITY_DN8840_c0_g1_i2.p1  ORF type:complete len:1254 (-),score=236.15 TRINITY_DN8840_c0_g1_i2:121-3837(-)